jgi:hypothetical protein
MCSPRPDNAKSSTSHHLESSKYSKHLLFALGKIQSSTYKFKITRLVKKFRTMHRGGRALPVPGCPRAVFPTLYLTKMKFE